MKSELSFYVDTLIVESLVSNKMSKTAGPLTDSVVAAAKNYFSNHFDENNKVDSVINMIAPTAIAGAFSMMGMPWIGRLLGIATSVCHIDVSNILKSIFSALVPSIKSEKIISPEELNETVSSSVKENSPEDSNDLRSFSQLLMASRTVKLSLLNYELDKFAKPISPATTTSVRTLLSVIFRWFFRIILTSAGFMVAGDLLNKMVGRPNAFDNNLKTETLISHKTSTQTKFKLQPSYKDTKENSSHDWTIPITNNKSSIEELILSFAKEVYQGLDNLDSVIKSTPSFEDIVDNITFYNHNAEGNQLVIIPRSFKSKKEVVDSFIDDVASQVK